MAGIAAGVESRRAASRREKSLPDRRETLGGACECERQRFVIRERMCDQFRQAGGVKQACRDPAGEGIAREG